MTDFYTRLYQQNERVIKLGLDAIGKALAREPHLVTYPHVLIAGTNGKGQASALFSNALQMAGYRPGLYTSPHLVDFRERIRIAGKMIPAPDVIEIGTKILSEYGGDPCEAFSGIALTYFECCLMMALRYFFAQKADFGVFEVGLGGRLDATNALSPSLSIITSIGRDHEQYLGHTAPEIAREKAGIMRPHCPVICGRSEIDTLRAEARARQCSDFAALGHDFDWKRIDGQVHWMADGLDIILYGAEHFADFQCDNAAVASYALYKARQIGLIQGDILQILPTLVQRTRWVGRMWPCSTQNAQNYGVSQIIMDGAHNPDGAKVFVHSAAQNQRPQALIANSCADKDIESMFPLYLKAFKPQNIFITPIESTPRSCRPLDYCHRTGLPESQACESLDAALARAAKAVGTQGAVYISGSLYLIGEAISLLHETDSLEDIYLCPAP